LCIKLVKYWDKYTEMHGQQNVKQNKKTPNSCPRRKSEVRSSAVHPVAYLLHCTDSATMTPNLLYLPLYYTALDVLPVQPVDA